MTESQRRDTDLPQQDAEHDETVDRKREPEARGSEGSGSAEGRDCPPSKRDRDPNGPWLGGG